jgi:N-alpha-acetyltransferase 35, NatC auxiliary subunit
MNRSRFRRNLCHSIIEWDNFQVESEECDAQLADLTDESPLSKDQSYSYVLSSWIYLYKLRLLEWVVFLGFELDIYQPYEYSGMFWLAQFYARARLSHLVRISEFSKIRTPPQGLSAEKGREWQKKKISNIALLNYHMLDARAIEALSSASMSLYSVLTHLRLIPLPYTNSYASDELRYELRMKPFQQVVSPQIEPFPRAPEECFRPGSFREELEEEDFNEWVCKPLQCYGVLCIQKIYANECCVGGAETRGGQGGR